MKRMLLKKILVATCLTIVIFNSSYAQTTLPIVAGLKCNYYKNPTAIDELQPQLSWQIASTVRGETQTAYQLIVSSSKENLLNDNGDLWNSGKVLSEQSVYVPYKGKQLQSHMICFWKVRVWGNKGKLSNWSDINNWEMGLLNSKDWTAKWITASRWFTRTDYRSKGLEMGARGGWADIDLGKEYLIDSIKLYPYTIASFPKKFKIETAKEMLFIYPNTIIDESKNFYNLKNLGVQVFPVGTVKTRFIRLRILGDTGKVGTIVRQMEVMSNGKNVALMKFTREYGTDWNKGHAVFLVDGMSSQYDGVNCPEDACPIETAPIFRKTFNLAKKVKSASIYYAALGMVNMTINGKKVGDEELGPPFSDYYKRIYYVTHNVTDLLTNGENVIGATLGNGFFSTPQKGFGQRHSGNGYPKLLVQTMIEYADGSREVINSDNSWQWEKSEIVKNDVFEDYEEDRRQEKTGWKLPNYNASTWKKVAVSDAPSGKLVTIIAPPIRVWDTIKPSRTEGNHAFFNYVSSGWPQVKVNGKAQQVITIGGTGAGFKMKKIKFILGKDGTTVLQPRFVVLPGPTDLVVEGLNESLKKEDVCILSVNADLEKAGECITSNTYLNDLYNIVLRTHRNYVNDVPADPNREKQGWTQDAQNMFTTAAYFTDVKGLYQRWWRDMADNQDEQGYLGSVLPVVNRQVYDWNSPWWSGVIVYLPWVHYKYFGNKRVLEEAYQPMRKYVNFLSKMANTGEGKSWNAYPYFKNNLDSAAAKEQMIVWNGAGDWQNPFNKGQFAVPAPMTTMPAYYYYANIVSKTALLLNKTDDAEQYASLAASIKNRFNAKYFHPETGMYGEDAKSQTAQVLPLAVGMVPKGKDSLVYARLLDAIHARNDHQGGGFVALPFILETLASKREAALSNKIVNQKNYPSWTTLVKDGVLQESWNGNGAQMPSCGGAVGAWFYQSVLGIQPDKVAAGFKRFILAPQPDTATGLTWAKGYYECIYGKIISDWKLDNGSFFLHTSIPVNTSALIYLPSSDAASILDEGKPLNKSVGIKLINTEKGIVTLEVTSGEYFLSCK